VPFQGPKQARAAGQPHSNTPHYGYSHLDSMPYKPYKLHPLLIVIMQHLANNLTDPKYGLNSNQISEFRAHISMVKEEDGQGDQGMKKKSENLGPYSLDEDCKVLILLYVVSRIFFMYNFCFSCIITKVNNPCCPFLSDKIYLKSH